MLVHEAIHPQLFGIHQRPPLPLAGAPLGHQAIAVVDFRPVVVEAMTAGVLSIQIHRGQRRDAKRGDLPARIEFGRHLHLGRRARPHVELVRARDSRTVQKGVERHGARGRIGLYEPEIREIWEFLAGRRARVDSQAARRQPVALVTT